MEKLFMNICMDLWSYDAAITYDVFVNEINRIIANLNSCIGEDAHKHLEQIGVKDETGMTWQEQDEYYKREIDKYAQLLRWLSDDSNWTW